MIRSMKRIIGSKVGAVDGQIGKVMDFFFDDQSWRIRYVVVDAGSWLISKPVLISPKSFLVPDWDGRSLGTELTIQQIKNSPDICDDPPVAQQEKIKCGRQIWIPPGSPVGLPIHPILGAPTGESNCASNDVASTGDPFLRSLNEVIDYTIHAVDGEFGRVEDFIMESDGWVIRYMIVDTRNWLPGGKKVIISPSWIDEVDWTESRVSVNLTCGAIENCPVFDPSEPVNREYEHRLYDYYGRPVYWNE